MTAAIFGLLGVLVGGVLNGVVSVVIEAKRDSRALQAAARLLTIDVATALAAYDDCLEDGDWSTLPTQPLPLDQWEEWKVLVSSRIESPADWRKVMGPFLDMRHNNDLAAGHANFDQMSAPSQEGMRKAKERIDEALPVLTRYVHGEHFLWGRTKKSLGLSKRPPSQPLAIEDEASNE